MLSLKELVEVAHKSLNIDDLFELLLEKALAVSGARIGSVLRVEPEKERFRVVAKKGLDPTLEKNAFIDFKDSLLRHVLAKREPLLVKDIETDERVQKPNNPKYGTPSFLSVPLFIKDDIVAILNLSNKGTKDIFDQDDRQIVSLMINEISFALENALLYTKVRTQLKSIQEKTGALISVNEQLEQEIAERKLAETALRESEARYRLLIENANDGIFILQDDLVKFPNPKIQELTGYSEEELSRISFEVLIHPEDREEALSRHDSVLRQKEPPPGPYTFKLQTKGEDVLWVQLNAVPIVWEDKRAVLHFLRDVTEQKKLEHQFYQAQKMESIKTLAGGIAHEFNNLLMGVQGNTTLMLMDTKPVHPFSERLKNIEESVKRGANLTRQLLGFAREGRYEAKPMDINALIRKTAEIFSHTKKEMVIHTECPENIRTVEADSSQLEQVLLDLYVNAWQAMPGGGELFIQTENFDTDGKSTLSGQLKPGKYVKISLTDTGIGMDEITRKRIFEPFFTTQEPGKGTGMGLSAAYGIIQNHGGTIDVYSEKGKQTTFHIYLPATEKQQIKEVQVAELRPKEEKTLLLVDDEEMILEVTRRLLEKLGYTVLAARSGKEAIDIYKANQEKIDGVIVDMIMSEMGGGETFDRLKAVNPHVKVLLSSGYGIDGNAQEILDRGCIGFIQKPFKLANLSQKVMELFEK